ncbi:GNAT family N-acetyltransferase [Egicoccus sp. AB-alg2]|uniref:GNAT family N-acetyltransferase n=1 Tax=Egicoccus sp. AB-alg2 TaxID=3242693 RepID=UPI00359E4960
MVLRVDDDVVAIAPLQRRLTLDGTLRLISEYDASGFRYADEASLRWLVDAVLGLRRPLVLTSLLAGSATQLMLRARLRHRPWVRWVHVWTMGPDAVIDATYADPTNSLVSSRRSGDGAAAASPVSSRWVRRRLRKAEQLGRVTFHVDPVEEDASDRFEELVRVEAASWKGRNGSAMIDDASQRETIRRFVSDPEVRAGARLAAMRIDGEPVAMNLVMVRDGRLWTLKDGFDERFASLSPGLLLFLHVLAWAHEQGLTRVELLGRMEAWKRDWGTGRTLHHLRVYPPSRHGTVAFTRDVLDIDKVRRTLRARRYARSGSPTT